MCRMTMCDGKETEFSSVVFTVDSFKVVTNIHVCVPLRGMPG